MKNPLLSSAVTGLSLEDLTHKAVLLPAAPSQTLVTRSAQSGSQHAILGDTDNVSYQSGDTNSNIHMQTINLNPQIAENLPKHDEKNSQTHITAMDAESKASQKSKDDFDVNEYFARLQGTRYVSAPLHHSKDDNAADLEATEANLEEINLNEPEKVVEIQNSLTADIAQNFSQLPNVLPHVASAVFSSFSNMLNYKSREITPDVPKAVYQESEKDVALEVPLMNVDEVKREIAPPPKELPVIGPGNYRITTKKKVYAQIPGLSLGETQTLTLNKPPNSNMNYFTPEYSKNVEHNRVAFTDTNIQNTIENAKSNLDDKQIGSSTVHFQEMINSNDPKSLAASQSIIPPPPTFSNLKGDNQHQTVVLPPSVARHLSGNQYAVPAVSTPDNIFVPTQSSDSELARSTLELDSNSPGSLRSHEEMTPGFCLSSNLPTFDRNWDLNTDSMTQSYSETELSSSLFCHQPKQASNNPMFTASENKTLSVSVERLSDSNDKSLRTDNSQNIPPQKTSNIPSYNETSGSAFDSTLYQQKLSSLPPPPIGKKPFSSLTSQENPLASNQRKLSSASSNPPNEFADILLPPKANIPPPIMFAPNVQMTSNISSNVGQTFQPLPYAPRRKTGSFTGSNNLPPNIAIFNPNNLTSSGTTNIAAYLPQEIISTDSKPFFTPAVLNAVEPTNQSRDIPSTFCNPYETTRSALEITAPTIISNDTKPEIIKPPEPPKVTASNFRMIKKRPQYYSGPIDGVGSISNNLKPTIPYVDTPGFSGSLYNPQRETSEIDSQEQISNIQNIFNPNQNLQKGLDINQANQGIQPFDLTRMQFELNKSNQTSIDPRSHDHYNVIEQSPFNLGVTNMTSLDTKTENQGYSTAFDISRPTTETYDAKDNRGFGLIGSLKSKLSSLDINRIQNSVTSFFDPAYNDIKKETNTLQVNKPYEQRDQTLSNFEVFVPNQQIGDQNYVPYHYQHQKQSSHPVATYCKDPYTASPNYPILSSLNNQEVTPGITSAISQVTVTEMHNQIPLVTHFVAPGTFPNNEALIRETNSVLESTDTATETSLGPIGSIPTLSTSFSRFETLDNSLRTESNISSIQHPISRMNPAMINKKTEFETQIQPIPLSLPEKSLHLLSEKASHTEIFSSLNQETRHIDRADISSRETAQTIFTPVIKVAQDATSLFPSRSIPEPNSLITSNVSATNFFDVHSPTHPSKLDYVTDQNSSVFSFTEPLPIGANNHTKANISQKNVNSNIFANDTTIIPSNLTSNFGNLKVENTSLPLQGAEIFDMTAFSTPDLITDLFSNFKETKAPNDSPLEIIDSKMTRKDSISKLGARIQDIDTVKDLDITKITTDLPPAELFSKFKEKDPSDNSSKSLLESITKEDKPIVVGVSSVPLFGLSTIIADESNEMKEIEDNLKNMTLFVNKSGLFDKNASVSFFENISQNTYINKLSKENVIKTNVICSKEEIKMQEAVGSIEPGNNLGTDILGIKTSEAYKEQQKEDDVTNQLIENITAPIQLQNAVEVPLTESVECKEIDSVEDNQLQKITEITEETIEAIHGQVASELLDDDVKPTNYGWVTSDNEKIMDSYNFKKDDQTGFQFDINPENVSDHDYSFKMDPNAVGFYGKNSLFFDKVEGDIEVSKVLPRQMSIPTAPPEEDTKSEGIDVHSIEQDAKQDFPIFEEYIIEPDNEPSDAGNVKDSDTFTNRVERFKQMEESGEDNIKLHLPKSPVIMASYFDTGNYAVETYYKNIATPVLRIPPGFEDEYRRMSFGHHFDTSTMPAVFIPETSTQTKSTVTHTYSMSNQEIGFTLERDITKLLDDKSPGGSSPVCPNSALQKPDTEPNYSTVKTDLKSPCMSDSNKNIEKALFPKINSPNLTIQNVIPDTDIQTKVEKENVGPELALNRNLPPMLDPTNFFNAAAEPINIQNEDNSFNRLASYFNMSPERPDHSKPFFELSQSQNHYRHESNKSRTILDNKNIPNDRYLANLNLIRDLTAPQNAVVSETIVRTVNYFTVEYDNDVKDRANRNINKKLGLNENNKNNDKQVLNENLKINDQEILNGSNQNNKSYDKELNIEIYDCQFCCNFLLHNIIDTSNIKVKKAVNDSSKHGGPAMNMESSKEQSNRVTVDYNSQLDDESSDGVAVINENRPTAEYAPVQHHWFYRVDVEDNSIWRGFSVQDSKALEDAFHSPDLNENTLVATDGGRYDVNVVGRIRTPVYWNDKPTNVRRCSWFYKGTTDARYVPYTEAVAERLEMEYRHGITTGEWHRRLVLPNSELVVMHGPGVMVHLLQAASADGFSAPPQSMSRPRLVRRGHEEWEVEDPQPSKVDHLLLLCHGVGSACDMRFRSLEEVVEDFRTTSTQLIQSHYNNSFSNGVINRVEVLPISWHSTLHSGQTGVDRRLAQITLDSIPRLRSFTNDTVLDVLFYTSPVYCQTIIDTVCSELNRIYKLFRERNPGFKGGVSLGGHSLGSVILYDLLCHQQPNISKDCSPSKSHVSGCAGTGQPSVKFPQLTFNPDALYALGSPIAIFECIRGVESLGMDFCLPTCKNFFNIFHPYDPIAYRIEPLINPQLRRVKPFLIPHHKGRKRMHLELKDTMVRVGADLKQKLVESLKATWNKWKSSASTSEGQLEKVVEEEMDKEQLCGDKDDADDQTASAEMLGRLNSGRRIDYVLQEAPLEMINEYLFAMTSHVGYWESEDTMLLMLREIYSSLGVVPDSSVPQQTLTVERTRNSGEDSPDPSTSRGGLS